MEATLTPPTTEARVVENSDGLLLEIDGRIVPNYDATIVPFEEGDVVTGAVVRIDKDEVLVDIGYKSEGVIPSNELSIRKSVDPNEEVELGEEVDALVLTKEDQDGRLILSKKRARFERAWRRIEAAAESGEPVHGSVIEVVKGGLIVDLGVRGFLPASLVDIRRVPNLDEYLGQTIESKVIELNRSRNNVVLSRRAVLEEERKEQRQAILERLQPGLIIEGQISNIVDFGAFVDLDGIDGLIHISELSWSHVNHPSEILSIGDTVQVKVLDIDRDRQRISLGLKQTQEDPWQRVVDTYNVGDELEGTVTKVVAFGAFVEILEGVEGLVHISELAQQHVENPREIVQPGDDVKVKILEIDSERRRLSLSIKRVEGQVLPTRDRQARRRRAGPATSTRCRSSACPRTSSRERGWPRSTPDETAEATAEPVEAARPTPTSPPRRRPPSRLSRRAEPSRTRTGVAAAVRRADRRPRRRQVGGPGGARAAGRRHAVDRRGGPRAVRRPRGARRRRRPLGARAWRPAGAWTAPRSPGTRSPTPASAPGSRRCCGRASAPAWRPGGRRRPRAGRRRARSWSRCRCCSRPGWRAPSTRPSPSWPTRDAGRPRRRPRARGARRARRPPARPGREGRARGSRRPQRPGSRALEQELSRVLEKLDGTMSTRSAPTRPRAPPRRARGRRARARARGAAGSLPARGRRRRRRRRRARSRRSPTRRCRRSRSRSGTTTSSASRRRTRGSTPR